MQLTRDEIKTLVNGLFQSGAKPKEQFLDQDQNPVEVFIFNLLSKNFLANDGEKKTGSKSTSEAILPYSPLQSGQKLVQSKKLDFLKEYLHLCRTYRFFLHPVIVGLLFKKTSNVFEKSVLFNYSCSYTKGKMIHLGWLNPAILDPNEQIPHNSKELLLQMFLFVNDSDYQSTIYQKMDQLQQLSHKREFLNQLRLKERKSFPLHWEKLPSTASKNWNIEWLKFQLQLAGSAAHKESVHQISIWMEQNGEGQSWSNWTQSGKKACGLDNEEEWLFFLIANTHSDILMSVYNEKGIEIISEFLHPAFIYNALFFNNIELAIEISNKTGVDQFVEEIRKMDASPTDMDLSWDFIKKLVGHLRLPSGIQKWKVYHCLLKYFHAFLPDSFTSELIPQIKDTESRILLSEEGVKLMSFLAGKLSLQANPIYLPKLENYKKEVLYHPLEKDLDKLIVSWKFRLEMRKDFERAKKRYTRDEKK